MKFWPTFKIGWIQWLIDWLIYGIILLFFFVLPIPCSPFLSPFSQLSLQLTTTVVDSMWQVVFAKGSTPLHPPHQHQAPSPCERLIGAVDAKLHNKLPPILNLSISSQINKNRHSHGRHRFGIWTPFTQQFVSCMSPPPYLPFPFSPYHFIFIFRLPHQFERNGSCTTVDVRQLPWSIFDTSHGTRLAIKIQVAYPPPSPGCC